MTKSSPHMSDKDVMEFINDMNKIFEGLDKKAKEDTDIDECEEVEYADMDDLI